MAARRNGPKTDQVRVNFVRTSAANGGLGYVTLRNGGSRIGEASRRIARCGRGPQTHELPRVSAILEAFAIGTAAGIAGVNWPIFLVNSVICGARRIDKPVRVPAGAEVVGRSVPRGRPRGTSAAHDSPERGIISVEG